MELICFHWNMEIVLVMHVIKRRVKIWRELCVHASVYDFTARCVCDFLVIKMPATNYTHNSFFLSLGTSFPQETLGPHWLSLASTASAADTCIIHTLWFSCVKLILIEFLMMFFYLNRLSVNVYISFEKFTRGILHTSRTVYLLAESIFFLLFEKQNACLGQLWFTLQALNTMFCFCFIWLGLAWLGSAVFLLLLAMHLDDDELKCTKRN